MLKAQTESNNADSCSEEVAALIRKVRETSLSVSNPENYNKLQEFIKADRVRIRAAIDQQDAEEKKVSVQEARARRNKMMARNKRKLADDAILMLSDEQSGSETEDLLQIESAIATDTSSTTKRPDQ